MSSRSRRRGPPRSDVYGNPRPENPIQRQNRIAGNIEEGVVAIALSALGAVVDTVIRTKPEIILATKDIKTFLGLMGQTFKEHFIEASLFTIIPPLIFIAYNSWLNNRGN